MDNLIWFLVIFLETWALSFGPTLLSTDMKQLYDMLNVALLQAFFNKVKRNAKTKVIKAITLSILIEETHILINTAAKKWSK